MAQDTIDALEDLLGKVEGFKDQLEELDKEDFTLGTGFASKMGVISTSHILTLCYLCIAQQRQIDSLQAQIIDLSRCVAYNKNK